MNLLARQMHNHSKEDKMFSYKLRRFLFSWNKDEEGDIVFSVLKRVHFIKYKEHTIVKFGKKNYVALSKYVEV